MIKTFKKKLNAFDPDQYAIGFPFYTPNDKRFRYLRDDVLGPVRYNHLMDKMIITSSYDVRQNAELLWIKENQIRKLHESGHIIGLHSYSHPTKMENKTAAEQALEYGKNKQGLQTIIGENIVSVSYPCNSYNLDTINCMTDMNIQIGFRANMMDVHIANIKLEYPREDHANILREWRKSK